MGQTLNPVTGAITRGQMGTGMRIQTDTHTREGHVKATKCHTHTPTTQPHERDKTPHTHTHTHTRRPRERDKPPHTHTHTRPHERDKMPYTHTQEGHVKETRTSDAAASPGMPKAAGSH